MKHIHYLYIAAFTFLIACSSEERITTTDSNEKPSGPIELSAGIVEGSTKATTRSGAEDNHANHQALTSDTKLALRVSGTWTGHGESPYAVVKTTTATVGAETSSGSKHNSLTCSPLLYWDDYGSADPANATGRTEGLTIYGAAVNSKPVLSIAENQWTAYPWELPADQTVSGSYPADKDLLISNNIKAGTGDGTYKFDSSTSGKLLEFTHALSKITVNLNANSGFASGIFASSPEVKLTSNNASTSNAEWAYTTGTVNITDGTVSSQGNASVITMWQATSAPSGYDVTKEALVMPGSQFTADNAIIARINADGNIYYVTAQKIRTAISASHASEGAYSTEAGKNYIINVTVNKTSIDVTATVANWTDVTAAEEAPVINVAGSFGGGSGSLSKDYFSFYRSTLLNTGYGTSAGTYYTEERRVRVSDWKMGVMSGSWTEAPLYWPNHNTHYQFRGVWPCTGTETGVVVYPRVETATHSATQYQVIKVSNVAYSANTFPSDLQIARPEIDPSTTCSNSDHTAVSLYNVGICATEGNINLNFRYMMSQVEVNLTSVTGEGAVTLTNAVVELVNVKNDGDVKLGDREVIPTGDAGSYQLTAVDGSPNKRLNAIVPQELTYTAAQAEGNVRFKITITNSDASTDIYYADIAPIKKTSSSEYVAKHVTSPDKWYWESGVHYVYNLKLSKTEIKVTASLANWTTVTASQDIWF